jgi:hypothetical protein
MKKSEDKKKMVMIDSKCKNQKDKRTVSMRDKKIT